jgi:hypothetical protein
MWGTSGALALLFFLDVKFAHTFLKNIEYFNTHYKISRYLSNKFTNAYHQGS